jgi:glycogen debranching enzyme
MTMANTRASAQWFNLAHSLSALDAAIPSLYAANAARFHDLLATHTSIETPDRHLDDAFSWAIASIDQLRVETPTHDGEAFTAGFLSSGDSVRPGFGWFFGRDALWTLYATDSYGDFPAARQEFDFLLRQQRADGKIMHEYSQTANVVDWQSLPYEYAAADATPLLLMAMNDYLHTSGDLDFVRSHWENLARAWNFETTHVSPDGFFNNTQGTGWVENWTPRLPAQEIYLAALDEEASLAFADLARAAGHSDLAAAAAARAQHLAHSLEQEYFLPSQDFYAFSRNPAGTTDDTPTIYPAVAWWDGSFELQHPDAMFQRWASDEFSTDWGTRDVGGHVSFFDPISYHEGSVWPLFTGWVSLAEYRGGHPLAGYAHLMQNADLTWAEDLGNVTELLSGQYFQVLGRSTAHQLWSSAMVISPVLRGMFGLEWNAPANTLTVTPRLPAHWTTATVRHIPIGNSTLDLTFTRQGSEWLVTATGTNVHLASHAAQARVAGNTLHVPTPAVEVAVPAALPIPGAQTEQMKVLNEQHTPHSLTLTLSAPGSSTQTFSLRENLPHLRLTADHAEIGPEHAALHPVTVQFPAGQGYVTQTVTFSW